MVRQGVAFEVQTIPTREVFLEKLLAKLTEEASGVVSAVSTKQVLMDEIADLERVIVEIKKQYDIDEREMSHVRAKNFHEKGGFDGRVLLVWSQKDGYTSNEKS